MEHYVDVIYINKGKIQLLANWVHLSSIDVVPEGITISVENY